MITNQEEYDNTFHWLNRFESDLQSVNYSLRLEGVHTESLELFIKAYKSQLESIIEELEDALRAYDAQQEGTNNAYFQHRRHGRSNP